MRLSPPTYRHTQHARLCWLLYGVAGAMVVATVVLRDVGPAPFVLAFTAAIVVVLAAGFHHLTVEDGGDRLLISFGPLPLFRRSVRYADVTGVEVGRTTTFEGWGIHLSPRGGWVWNIAGRDCVIVALRRGRLTIGTDDAVNLAAFLRARTRAEV
jgi:hypothetical protein